MDMITTQTEFKSLDKSLRKQKIIDTAALLFHHKGYASTTLDDVAGELGISKAALYHYVGSKDELLSIIYTQAFDNVFKDTYEISGMDLPPDEKLRLMIRNHINNIIIKDLSMFSVFFSEENQLPEKDFKKIRKEKKKYTRIVEQIIAEGISQGMFKKVDPTLQAYAILGMCNWIYKWYKPDKTTYTPEQIADHFISLLQQGYLESSGPDTATEINTAAERLQPGVLKSDKPFLKQLKDQCSQLIALIEKLEK
jgi:AcrR family transcriptional regulator